MSKGRNVPPAQIDHAANLRERLGKAAYEAFPEDDYPSVAWERLTEAGRESWRAVGDAVLKVVKTPGRRLGDLSVASVYTPDGRALVELTTDTSPSQFSPGKAREIGLMLLEAADAAESDALIARFGRETLDLSIVQAAQLIDQFRKLRERARGEHTEAA